MHDRARTISSSSVVMHFLPLILTYPAPNQIPKQSTCYSRPSQPAQSIRKQIQWWIGDEREGGSENWNQTPKVHSLHLLMAPQPVRRVSGCLSAAIVLLRKIQFVSRGRNADSNWNKIDSLALRLCQSEEEECITMDLGPGTGLRRYCTGRHRVQRAIRLSARPSSRHLHLACGFSKLIEFNWYNLCPVGVGCQQGENCLG